MQCAVLSWYDAVAALYDLGTFGDWFYQAARREAIKQLQLTRGDAVMDFFCGTGVNFEGLREQVGPAGTVIGADGSAAMLKRARPRAARDAVSLLRADFSTRPGRHRLAKAARQQDPAAYLFTLGLTCLPGWRAFFAAVYEAASAGARFAIMDVYSPRLTLGARYLNWVGAADCRRPVWEVLAERSANFRKEMRRPFRLFGAEVLDASVVVASGRKPKTRDAQSP